MDLPILWEIFGGVAAVVTIIGSIWALISSWKKEIKAEIREIRHDMNQQNKRMDQHAQRIDRLYEMFVDLLEARKG